MPNRPRRWCRVSGLVLYTYPFKRNAIMFGSKTILLSWRKETRHPGNNVLYWLQFTKKLITDKVCRLWNLFYIINNLNCESRTQFVEHFFNSRDVALYYLFLIFASSSFLQLVYSFACHFQTVRATETRLRP